MSRLDPSHNPERGLHDEQLSAALHDVIIPEGLESRLLMKVANPMQPKDPECPGTDPSSRPHRRIDLRSTRRRWLGAGIAAGLGGLALGGVYRWMHRPLAAQHILLEVADSLNKDDWALTWNREPNPQKPFPPSLRPASGWQLRKTLIDSNAIAFNLTLLGTPAVLFAMKTTQGSLFPIVSAAKPQVLSGPEWKDKWNFASIWRDASSCYLYVLAYNGHRSDFDRFFVAGKAVEFA